MRVSSFKAVVAKLVAIFAVCLSAGAPSRASDEHLSILIDADFSVTPAPGEAIALGLRAAFHGTWAETGITVARRDHRRNARRSLGTLHEAEASQDVLAVMGGMQSVPYFLNHTEINSARIPFLLLWSAGGGLTRLARGDENWMFRLSVDDTKSAAKMAKFSWETGCRKMTIVQRDDPWGNGNAERITREFTAMGGVVASDNPVVQHIGEKEARRAALTVAADDPDCVLFVGGALEGSHILNALSELPTPVRTISHWGVLGLRLTDLVPFENIRKLDLAILGTCGLYVDRNRDVYATAMERVGLVSNETFDPELHPAPHGFFHAYDMGLILRAAIEDARQAPQWNGSTQARRDALRNALYDLERPIEGLLRTYVSPFRPVTDDDLDGHEALGGDDLCMTTLSETGAVIGLSDSAVR